VIRTLKVLFCDNEHGCGDVTFPDAHHIDPDTILNHTAATTKGLRRQARKAGWKRIQGADYCPVCVDCEENRE
jgi:glycine/D-amino acid oxidase-like deaminating enzyme